MNLNLSTQAKRTEWLPALANPYMPEPEIRDGTIGGGQKTPRNAPCPCGSGKKWKRCHGADL